MEYVALLFSIGALLASYLAWANTAFLTWKFYQLRHLIEKEQEKISPAMEPEKNVANDWQFN